MRPNFNLGLAACFAALAGCTMPATGPDIDFAAQNREHHRDMHDDDHYVPRAAPPNGPESRNYVPQAAPPSVSSED